ncbi:MAG: hypothetical protein O9353_03170 [Bacteroidia bacterium]|nr:hypothetical protein [Bacteroidia bacterium]
MISKTLLLIAILATGKALYSQAKYTPVSSADFLTFHETVSSAERMYEHDSLLQAYAKYDIAFNGYKGTVIPRTISKPRCVRNASKRNTKR